MALRHLLEQDGGDLTLGRRLGVSLPLRGVVGLYLPDNGPKYFKGPARPTPGDLSFTELPVLGP